MRKIFVPWPGWRALAKQYKYFGWAALVPVYIVVFLLVEKYAHYSTYYVSYIPLDDKIPFLPGFVVPYFLWFPSLVSIGLHHLFFEPDAFRRYLWTLMLGFWGTLIFCLIFPNGQDLRPADLGTPTLFTHLVQSIYNIDTNTNVLPSMHVIGTMAVVFAVFDSPRTRTPLLVTLAIVVCSLITLATVFIKQHSALDIFAGWVASAALYLIVYVLFKRLQAKGRLP